MAEYIIELAKECSTEKAFLSKLEEDEALFSSQFSSNLYFLIQKMLPEQLKSKNSLGNPNDQTGKEKKFSISGTYIEPEHLTFEQREILEATDRKIMAAK